jgi:hypothetical protein
MRLLEEFLSKIEVYSSMEKNDKNVILTNFQQDFPITKYARIDWNIINQKWSVDDMNSLRSVFDLIGIDYDKDSFYTIWDDNSLPIIRTEIKNVLENLDDATAVSFDTWLYNPEKKVVIEFFHDGETTLGISNHLKYIQSF